MDSQPDVYYFAAVGGGVWTNDHGGSSWPSVSDGQPFGTSSVGAITVAASHPNVLYAEIANTTYTEMYLTVTARV
jgi:hypothetical protein